MPYEQRIRQSYEKMSKSFKRLANYILDSYIETALMTATELAHSVDVDAATVVRFAQYLDYEGFPELQRDIRERVRQELIIRPQTVSDGDSISSMATNAINDLTEAFERAKLLLNTDAITQFVDKIENARRIIILSESLAETAAYLLLQILEEGGYPAYCVQRGITDIARALFSLNSEDLLIAIEVKGETPFVTRALAAAQKSGVTTGAIVSAPSLPSANHADFVLTLQSKTSEGMGIVMIDAMIYALSQALRWNQPDRYKIAHRSISKFSKQIQGKN